MAWPCGVAWPYLHTMHFCILLSSRHLHAGGSLDNKSGTLSSSGARRRGAVAMAGNTFMHALQLCFFHLPSPTAHLQPPSWAASLDRDVGVWVSAAAVGRR